MKESPFLQHLSTFLGMISQNALKLPENLVKGQNSRAFNANLAQLAKEEEKKEDMHVPYMYCGILLHSLFLHADIV